MISDIEDPLGLRPVPLRKGDNPEAPLLAKEGWPAGRGG